MEPNLAQLAAAVAAAVPDRECLVHRDVRRTWRELSARIQRLANVLGAHGLGLHRERGARASHQSRQGHGALCLYNGPDYLESMLGWFAPRDVPINVNSFAGALSLAVALALDDDLVGVVGERVDRRMR